MKKNQLGFSLVELIIVIAIMAVLVAILAPTYLHFVEKARRSKYINEADVFYNAAKVSIIDYSATDGNLKSSQFTASSGKKYGRLTNWIILNPTSPNSQGLAKVFNNCLNMDKDEKLSTLPISTTVPSSSNGPTKMSMNEELIFQVLYTDTGEVIVEYNRNGYFVRITDAGATCVKLTGENDSQFTRVRN